MRQPDMAQRVNVMKLLVILKLQKNINATKSFWQKLQ
jgi:hypothetical protein